MDLHLALAVVFWSCLALVAYAYAGYPVLVWLLARAFGRPPRQDRLPESVRDYPGYRRQPGSDEKIEPAT